MPVCLTNCISNVKFYLALRGKVWVSWNGKGLYICRPEYVKGKMAECFYDEMKSAFIWCIGYLCRYYWSGIPLIICNNYKTAFDKTQLCLYACFLLIKSWLRCHMFFWTVICRTHESQPLFFLFKGQQELQSQTITGMMQKADITFQYGQCPIHNPFFPWINKQYPLHTIVTILTFYSWTSIVAAQFEAQYTGNISWTWWSPWNYRYLCAG